MIRTSNEDFISPSSSSSEISAVVAATTLEASPSPTSTASLNRNSAKICHRELHALSCKMGAVNASNIDFDAEDDDPLLDNDDHHHNHSGNYSHGHDHEHGGHDDEIKKSRRARNKLIIASVLCTLFMTGEFVGGLLSNSLAIMTDAAHMLSDLAGFLISLFAIWVAARPASTSMSFGYHRAEIIGALFSVFLIWALTIWLVYEAVERIKAPDTISIDANVMLGTASGGVLINIIMLLTLHQGHGHSHGGGHGHSHGDNINVKAAFIHALGDLVQSTGVLIAAIIIKVHPTWTIVDPICTFIFSALVLFTTISILKEGLHVLMEGTPVGIHPSEVKAALQEIPGVMAVYDLHIWSLTIGKAALAAHLEVDVTLSHSCNILRRCEATMLQEFNIRHTTLQLECTREKPSGDVPDSYVDCISSKMTFVKDTSHCN